VSLDSAVSILNSAVSISNSAVSILNSVVSILNSDVSILNSAVSILNSAVSILNTMQNGNGSIPSRGKIFFFFESVCILSEYSATCRGRLNTC